MPVAVSSEQRAPNNSVPRGLRAKHKKMRMFRAAYRIKMTCAFLHVFGVLRAYVLSHVCVHAFETTGDVMPKVRPDVIPGVRPDVMPGVKPDRCHARSEARCCHNNVSLVCPQQARAHAPQLRKWLRQMDPRNLGQSQSTGSIEITAIDARL